MEAMTVHLVVAALLLGTPSDARASTPVAAAAAWRLPPKAASFDYQLGGAYPPPADARVVARDRTDPPAPGVYGICYINGFQTQAVEAAWWLKQHPNLLLRDADGALIGDPDWPGEYVLDTTTRAKRAAIAKAVAPWIAGCARAGFAAVEFDNLDTHTRYPRLTAAGTVDLAQRYVSIAHRAGLAVAQKNSAELLPRRKTIGFDFAVVESCGTYDECGPFVAAFPGHVYDIEYEAAGFATACREAKASRSRLSVIRRDRDLSPPEDPAHIRETC